MIDSLVEKLEKKVVLADGAMGTYFSQKYMTEMEAEEANIATPERIIAIHKEYIEAGAELIRTNTFAVNHGLFAEAERRKEVIEAVEQLRKEKNVTVILITHYMEEVIDADQVFVMDEGHVVMHGTPKEIFSRVDELKKYRMDVPQVTMLADALIQKGVPLPKGILRREELVDALCQLS